jgi:hypothetical protein
VGGRVCCSGAGGVGGRVCCGGAGGAGGVGGWVGRVGAVHVVRVVQAGSASCQPQPLPRRWPRAQFSCEGCTGRPARSCGAARRPCRPAAGARAAAQSIASNAPPSPSSHTLPPSPPPPSPNSRSAAPSRCSGPRRRPACRSSLTLWCRHSTRCTPSLLRTWTTCGAATATRWWCSTCSRAARSGRGRCC